MTKSQNQMAYWGITVIGFATFSFCILTGKEMIGWLMVFPIIFLVRYLMTRDKGSNKL